MCVAIIGCARARRVVPEPRVVVRVMIIGRSVEGRDLVAHQVGSEGATVLVIGSIHGNEPAGAMLCKEIIRRIDPLQWQAPRVIVIPEANPDGLADGRRTNARGIDINRNFPAASFRYSIGGASGALSEPESRAIHDMMLTFKPDLILSIHQPLEVVDYDGPASEPARMLAARSGLPLHRLGARAGSLGSWAGVDLGIPVITLELPRGVERDGAEALWQAYGLPIMQMLAETAPDSK